MSADGLQVAELKLQEAIEAAKVEQEAKIREKRENEDLLRYIRKELEGKDAKGKNF